MPPKLIALLAALALQGPGPWGPLPPGFTRVFNGQNLAGWRISLTNHHGRTSEWRIDNGILSATQDRPGHGGILLSDAVYRDFEVYLEIKPDFGCDGGLFLRSSEQGHAYQVMIDYLEGGSVGGIYGERLPGTQGVRPQDYLKHWKKDDWNTLRARIEGTPPTITVWLNDQQIVHWTDTETRARQGHLALQVHGGKRWVEKRFHRFRNIAVRELR